jgi:hypothetical protein
MVAKRNILFPFLIEYLNSRINKIKLNNDIIEESRIDTVRFQGIYLSKKETITRIVLAVKAILTILRFLFKFFLFI